MAFLVLETDVQTVTKEAGNNPKVFFSDVLQKLDQKKGKTLF